MRSLWISKETRPAVDRVSKVTRMPEQHQTDRNKGDRDSSIYQTSPGARFRAHCSEAGIHVRWKVIVIGRVRSRDPRRSLRGGRERQMPRCEAYSASSQAHPGRRLTRPDVRATAEYRCSVPFAASFPWVMVNYVCLTLPGPGPRLPSHRCRGQGIIYWLVSVDRLLRTCMPEFFAWMPSYEILEKSDCSFFFYNAFYKKGWLEVDWKRP